MEQLLLDTPSVRPVDLHQPITALLMVIAELHLDGPRATANGGALPSS